MKTAGAILMLAACAIAFFQLPLALAYAVGIPGLLMACGDR